LVLLIWLPIEGSERENSAWKWWGLLWALAWGAGAGTNVREETAMNASKLIYRQKRLCKFEQLLLSLIIQ